MLDFNQKQLAIMWGPLILWFTCSILSILIFDEIIGAEKAFLIMHILFFFVFVIFFTIKSIREDYSMIHKKLRLKNEVIMTNLVTIGIGIVLVFLVEILPICIILLMDSLVLHKNLTFEGIYVVYNFLISLLVWPFVAKV